MTKNVFAFACVCFLAACTTLAPRQAEQARDAAYTPVAFAALPGWNIENADGALAALKQSCAALLKRPATASVAPAAIGGTAGDWAPACQAAQTQQPDARAYFETWFTPYKIDTSLGDDGLFTGYYEAVMHGSRTRTAQYSVPIYKRPPELVIAELGDFRPALKGERIAGSVADGKLRPYADRAAIEGGVLAGRQLELAYAADPNDVFFLQVQGSGRLLLPDGSVMRLNYDGQNGFPYTAIGRELIARGELSKDEVSLTTIRHWLDTHPGQAAALRDVNKSYVFFKEAPDDGGVTGPQMGPMGAESVALTPERSLAVDPRFIPYGAPVFLSMQNPQQSDGAKVQRLLIAQDTGGAITGPVRGDVFWGAGDNQSHAAQLAGAMKSRGQAWVLLPKTLQGARHAVLAAQR